MPDESERKEGRKEGREGGGREGMGLTEILLSLRTLISTHEHAYAHNAQLSTLQHFYTSVIFFNI